MTECERCTIARHERDSAVRELADFKQRVRARMIQEAEDRDWCEDFDRILAEFGLEPRTRNWRVTFEIIGTVEVTLLAKNADHASELAGHGLGIEETDTYEIGSSRARRELYITNIAVSEVEGDYD
jgi:hypothetical protein